MIGSGAPPAARSLTHPFAYLETEQKQKNKRKHYDKTGERVNTEERRGAREARDGVAGTGGGRGVEWIGGDGLACGGVGWCEADMFVYGECLGKKIGEI
jgi:hypothetical protein